MFNSFLTRPIEPMTLTLPEQIGMSQAEFNEWKNQVADQDEWWDWFSGAKLEERDNRNPGKNGQAPYLYPLQINPISQAARLHAYALSGEVPDTSDPLVKTMLEPKSDSDADKAIALAASVALSQVEYENHGRSQDTDAFLTIQTLGGIVMKVGLETADVLELPSGMRWEYIDSRNFWCHWGATYWGLDEAWVRYNISKEVALKYGVKVGSATATYVEYWNRDRYWIKVDGQFAKDADGTPYNRKHNFGFVPFIYVPHERADGFWGRSLVPEVIGLTRELNSRLADVGDAVHLGVNASLTARNLKSGYPVQKTLPDGQPYVDLGRAIGASDPQPEMQRIDAPTLPAGVHDFNSKLLEFIHTGMQTPDIAYGKEEGSQRSGQTLYNRMWPLLSHVRTERTHWTEARNLRAEMTLRILAAHQRLGITSEHLGLRKRQIWAPMVPVDRGQLVDELIKRMQSNGISLELLVEKFGDTADNKAEVERIYATAERLAKIEAEAVPPRPVGGPNAGAAQ